MPYILRLGRVWLVWPEDDIPNYLARQPFKNDSSKFKNTVQPGLEPTRICNTIVPAAGLPECQTKARITAEKNEFHISRQACRHFSSPRPAARPAEPAGPAVPTGPPEGQTEATMTAELLQVPRQQASIPSLLKSTTGCWACCVCCACWAPGRSDRGINDRSSSDSRAISSLLSDGRATSVLLSDGRTVPLQTSAKLAGFMSS